MYCVLFFPPIHVWCLPLQSSTVSIIILARKICVNIFGKGLRQVAISTALGLHSNYNVFTVNLYQHSFTRGGKTTRPHGGGENKIWLLSWSQKTIKSHVNLILRCFFFFFYLFQVELNQKRCRTTVAVATKSRRIHLRSVFLPTSGWLLGAAALHQKSIRSVDHRSAAPDERKNGVSNMFPRYNTSNAHAHHCDYIPMCLENVGRSGSVIYIYIKKAQSEAFLPVSSAQFKPPTGSSPSTCGSICRIERTPPPSRSDLVGQRS